MNQEQPIIVGLDIGTTKIAAIAGRMPHIIRMSAKLMRQRQPGRYIHQGARNSGGAPLPGRIGCRNVDQPFSRYRGMVVPKLHDHLPAIYKFA